MNKVLELSNYAVHRQALGSLPHALYRLLPHCFVAQSASESIHEGRGIVHREEKRIVVSNDRAILRDVRSDDHSTQGTGFDERVGHTLSATWSHVHVALLEEWAHILQPTRKRDALPKNRITFYALS
jgi:hypothetical protein